jgi:hypothetical protein
VPGIVVSAVDIAREANWSFSNSKPTWRHRRFGSVGTFDPFPAYPHDMGVVTEAATYVQGKCSPRWDVELFVADREEEGRSNGYSNVHQDGHYDDGDQWVKEPPIGLIMLSGKRVPPHPAVTRYLVAHEYGHNVEWMLNDLRGHAVQGSDVVTEYAQMRGMPTPIHHGSGGTWHDAAPEVFACDFRILVCGIEADYWPHPGVQHPSGLPDLAEWWEQAIADLSEAEQEN